MFLNSQIEDINGSNWLAPLWSISIMCIEIYFFQPESRAYCGTGAVGETVNPAVAIVIFPEHQRWVTVVVGRAVSHKTAWRRSGSGQQGKDTLYRREFFWLAFLL
jgi:hypothetical protein